MFHTWRAEKSTLYRVWWGKPESKKYLQEVSKDGRILLKLSREIRWNGVDWILCLRIKTSSFVLMTP
jgi:hypothetical protein